jgi:flagellar assembly protein FliH
MAKAVFHHNEVKKSDDKVKLRLVRNYEPEVEEVEFEEVPEYTGPTADDLRREAESFKTQWEAEKNRMIAQAQSEADAILKKTDETALLEVKRQNDYAQSIMADAQKQVHEIVKAAHDEADSMIQQAAGEQEALKKSAYDEGFKQGREDGYQEGNQEAVRLISRLHTVLERIMDKRQEILRETEQQVVDLVLLMTRKVVKAIAETQRGIVIANVTEALKKVKGSGDVIIRVNLSDVKLATEHADEFVKAVENVKNITIVEDTSVDAGGCVIETDFGAIDARIASQLSELEQKILEISPVKTIEKSSTLSRE